MERGLEQDETGWQSAITDPHYDTLARMAVRYPTSAYADVLAFRATAGVLSAHRLISVASDHAGVPQEVVDPTALAWFTVLAAARSDWEVSPQRLAAMCRWVRASPGEVATPRLFDGLEVNLGATSNAGPGPEDERAWIRERQWAASTDALNPFTASDGGDLGQWLTRLSLPFTESGRAPISLGPGNAAPFERLSSEAPPEPATDELISVIMPAFNPESGIVNAARSILAQTWSNVELLICDDGTSGDRRDILAECAALDPRVRIVRSEVNRGAYHARNMGLAAARGEFATFQDADDWSHPTRLAAQVPPLLEQPLLLATVSMAFGVSSDLTLSSVVRKSSRLNTSSLLFRREPVLRRLGGFDAVRRAADSEFVFRLRSVFGPGAVLHTDHHLAFLQLTGDSLSRNDFRLLYRHPARQAYQSNYAAWHAQIALGREGAFVRPGTRAPFPAPGHIRGEANGPVHVNFLLCANLSPSVPTCPEIAAEVGALAEIGKVALTEYLAPSDLNQPVTPPAIELAQQFRESVAMRILPGQSVHADLAVIRDPAACLLNDTDVLGEVRAEHVMLVADHAPDAAGGYDPRHVERTASTVAHRISWLPATGTIAQQLGSSGAAGEILAPRLWAAVHPADTSRGLSSRPVLGMTRPASSLTDEALSRWASRTLPEGTETLLWMWGRGRTGLSKAVPKVQRIDPARMSLDRFLRHIDYLVIPPVPGRGAHLHPVAVAALSRNCVVLLDPTYREHFGDAALYTDRVPVDKRINLFQRRPELWAAQCERGLNFVTEHVSPAALRHTVSSACVTEPVKESSC